MAAKVAEHLGLLTDVVADLQAEVKSIRREKHSLAKRLKEEAARDDSAGSSSPASSRSGRTRRAKRPRPTAPSSGGDSAEESSSSGGMDTDPEGDPQEREEDRQEAARAAAGAATPAATPPVAAAAPPDTGTLIRDQVLRDLAAAAERQAAENTPVEPSQTRGRDHPPGEARARSRTPPLEPGL